MISAFWRDRCTTMHLQAGGRRGAEGFCGAELPLMMGWVAHPDGTCAAVVQTEQEDLAMKKYQSLVLT